MGTPAGVIRVDDRTVRVEPPRVDEALVIEAAEALIEEYGWRSGERAEHSSGSVLDAGKEGGFSLHDAIGGACEMVSESEDVSGQRGSRDKEFRYSSSSGSGSMRQKVTALVQKVLPDGETDITFNDKQDDKAPVLDVLRRAREEATA